MHIRQETKSDFGAVCKLIEKAFENEAMSDHKEHFLVERLRQSDVFMPELSLVAEIDGTVVGHVLLTKITINNGTQSFESLALAPVSVLPDYQGKGIGGKLIIEAHEKAKALGQTSIVLLGHDQYYPRFGYKQADTFGIKLPFDVPKENVMVIELVENGLSGVSGVVEYPQEFFE